jgi:Sulfotransferase family
VADPRLPGVIVIGAMKAATSAVHAYLDAHPCISMSRPKELNFFNGPPDPPHDDESSWWRTGQWHRGVEWYARQFDPEAAVTGESSPAYSAPSAPEVPARMAAVVPDVRLVYLVREPFDRALSQYRHHQRDGTERRPAVEALLDPGSQYLARSRYGERLEPFLHHFPRCRLHVVVQERLLTRRRDEVEELHRHAGVEPHWDEQVHPARHHVGDRDDLEAVDPALRRRFRELVEDDARRLRELLGDDLPEWDTVAGG